MQAIVKDENKILINGADHSEKILIENMVKISVSKQTRFEPVLDINGEVTGCLITLEDSQENVNNNATNTVPGDNIEIPEDDSNNENSEEVQENQ